MNDARPPQGADADERAQGPNPNRERPQRQPPVIDGEAERLDAPPAAQGADSEKPESHKPEREKPAGATRSPLLAPLLAVGVAALVSAVAFFVLLPAGGGAPESAALQALEGRLSALEQETKAAESRAGEALARARASILAESAKAAAARPDALAALTTRLEAMEKALAAPKSEGRADPDMRAIAAAPADPAVNLAPLERRLAALEARLTPMEAALPPLQGALDQTREALRAAGLAENARAQTGATQTRAAAHVALAQALLGALDAGRPFAGELDALAAIGASAPTLDALKPLAQAGAPRLEALTRAFAQAEPRIAQANSQANSQANAQANSQANAPPASAGEGDGWLDKLARGASGFVRVRPVGEPDAAQPGDAPARIERALARGDLGAALAEWERLPEAAKAAGADWARQARARLAADAAAQSLLAEALARLARP
jgi:hypothetical protein